MQRTYILSTKDPRHTLKGTKVVIRGASIQEIQKHSARIASRVNAKLVPAR